MNSAPCMSLRDARRVLDIAVERAEALGARISVVVVDAGGRTLAMARMDGASYLTTALATSKATTSAGLGMGTQDFGEFAASMPLLLAAMSGQPDVNLLGGGVPVTSGGTVVGAVGVAGGTNGEDHPIAEAGVAALAAAGVTG